MFPTIWKQEFHLHLLFSALDALGQPEGSTLADIVALLRTKGFASVELEQDLAETIARAVPAGLINERGEHGSFYARAMYNPVSNASPMIKRKYGNRHLKDRRRRRRFRKRVKKHVNMFK